MVHYIQINCPISLEDIYHDGPESEVAPTTGERNIEETQNTESSDVLPLVLTKEVPGTAAPQPPASDIISALDTSALGAVHLSHLQTSHILTSSGRPQRRTNQTRFNLDELRKCTCDVNAEIHPDGGVIQCKNPACVTKWVRLIEFFCVFAINYQ